MSIQLGDAVVVDTQSLPDCVTALHNAVEYRNFCILARFEFAIDMHQDLGISGVGKVQGLSPVCARIACE